MLAFSGRDWFATRRTIDRHQCEGQGFSINCLLQLFASHGDTRLTVTSAEGVAQRGVIELRRRERGRAGATSKELLRHIGDVLLMQQKMVGRVETGEKPELLWEHPELERLYMRLADEYELRDRDRALDRKLDVVCRTVETLLSLVQTRSSLRVEWYSVLLIIAELLLTTYPLLLHR